MNELPVKEKTITIRKRWFYYLVIRYKNEMLIHQRMDKDIWQQLFEFPLIETKQETSQQKIISLAETKGLLKAKAYQINSVSSLFKQQLSHQLIAGQFIRMQLKRKINPKGDWIWISKNKMNKYAFPKFINQYLEEKTIEQSLF